MSTRRQEVRDMMIDVAAKITADVLAKDRHPLADAIVRGVRRTLRKTDMSDGIDWLLWFDDSERRARWEHTVRPHILRQIADLRPN